MARCENGEGGSRVLVVEDSEPQARLLQLMLESDGYAVDVVYRAEQALAELREIAGFDVAGELPASDGPFHEPARAEGLLAHVLQAEAEDARLLLALGVAVGHDEEPAELGQRVGDGRRVSLGDGVR